MIQNRIDILKKFIADDPSDPFNIYALALEFVSINPTEAEALFHQLLNIHPTYLPTYYQAALFFANNGNTERAIETVQAGINLAKAQQNAKALSELNSLQDELIS